MALCATPLLGSILLFLLLVANERTAEERVGVAAFILACVARDDLLTNPADLDQALRDKRLLLASYTIQGMKDPASHRVEVEIQDTENLPHEVLDHFAAPSLAHNCWVMIAQDRELPLDGLLNEAVVRFPSPTESEVQTALLELTGNDPHFAAYGKPEHEGFAWGKAFDDVITPIAMIGMFAALVAALLRAGLSFHLAGMIFRTPDGRCAGRMRASLRSALPFTLPVVAAFAIRIGVSPTLAYIALAYVYSKHLVDALRHPEQGLFDQLVDVRLAPR